MSEIQSTGNTDRARRLERVRSVKKAQRAVTAAAARQTDRAEISTAAKLLGALKDLPPVREERVEAVRAKIDEPGFDVDAHFRNAMQKMLQDLGA